MTQAEDKPLPAACEIPAAPLTRLLGTITTLSRMLRDHQLAEIGLVSGQDRLLDTLHADELVSVTVLAQAMHIRPSTLSKMLDRMGERGLCRRERSTADQRLTMVRLTPEGLRLQSLVRQTYATSEAVLVRQLDGGERDTLLAELGRLQDALLRHASKVR